jgi:uncharacterized membrane protein
MFELLLGLVLLLGGHSVSIVAYRWRETSVQRAGKALWQAAYSLVALAGLWLVVRGYAEARLAPDVLWVVPMAVRHLAALLLLPVFPCLLAAYLPGRLRSTLQHPMLVAVKAWALAHLIIVGTLASTVLFGSVLAWAVVDRISLKRRPVRATPLLPASPLNDVIAVVGGLALYVFMILKGHLLWIGVAPFG